MPRSQQYFKLREKGKKVPENNFPMTKSLRVHMSFKMRIFQSVLLAPHKKVTLISTTSFVQLLHFSFHSDLQNTFTRCISLGADLLLAAPPACSKMWEVFIYLFYYYFLITFVLEIRSEVSGRLACFCNSGIIILLLSIWRVLSAYQMEKIVKCKQNNRRKVIIYFKCALETDPGSTSSSLYELLPHG